MCPPLSLLIIVTSLIYTADLWTLWGTLMYKQMHYLYTYVHVFNETVRLQRVKVIYTFYYSFLPNSFTTCIAEHSSYASSFP